MKYSYFLRKKNTTSKLLLEVSSSWENSLRYISFSPDWNLGILDLLFVHVTCTRKCPCAAWQTCISCVLTKTKNMQSPAYPRPYWSSVCTYVDQTKKKRKKKWILKTLLTLTSFRENNYVWHKLEMKVFRRDGSNKLKMFVAPIRHDDDCFNARVKQLFR